MGQRASQTTELSFTDAKVSKANILGKVGEGLRVAFSSLDNGRIGIASLSVGIAQAAFEEATTYAKDRIAFGKPIAEHQAIQMKLADMATQIEAARLLTLRAAAMKDANHKNIGVFSAQAKLFASETANRVCAEAIQIHGGNGYSRHYNVEKILPRRANHDNLRRHQRNAENHHFTRNFEGLIILRFTSKKLL